MTIICALADDLFVVPGSVFNHSCAKCDVRLQLAPSGQGALRLEPGAKLICGGCWMADPKREQSIETATLSTVASEVKAAVPNLRRHRN